MINPCEINVSVLPSIPFVWCKSLPSSPGIYFALSESDEVLYIGQSGNMRVRWRNHHKRAELEAFNCSKLCWVDVSDPSLLGEIEKALIEWFQPPLNKESKSQNCEEQALRVFCKLKQLMDAKGLNQTQVSQDTRLSPTIIGNLYRHPEVRRIDCGTAEVLLKYFGLKTLGDLYGCEWQQD